MTKTPDPYWDELGVAWCASEPNVGVIASRLARRLRWQSRWLAAGLLIGLPLCAAGVMVGVGTFIIGLSGAWNFVTRGVGILAMSLILGSVLTPLLGVAGTRDTKALSDMIDFAIERTQKMLALTRATLYSCAIAAVFGVAGTVIRTHIARPPRLSALVDLAVLAVIAAALYLWSRQLRVRSDQYAALRRALAVDEAPGRAG